MRIHHARPHPNYVELANKINRTMPEVGSDQQRGGWYDVVDRVRGKDHEATRFTWHDRKAWWQQEQAILAYQIMAGSTGDDEALRLGREAAAFYNAFFFDYEEGSVYFNVLANGIPYLLGTERQKGSHSMAGYHSFELAFLSTVYSNLLTTKEPMDLWFSPLPGVLPNNTLRVSPDILPPGSIRIGEVEVDGKPYADFDADGLTVHVPDDKTRHKIRVRVVPTIDPFEVHTKFDGDVAEMTLTGKLDMSTFVRLPDRGRERPRQEAEPAGPEPPGPRLDRQRRHPRPAVRPPADGHLGPGRHLRGRSQAPRSRRRSCAPIRTRRTSTSSRATTRSAIRTASASGPRRTRRRVQAAGRSGRPPGRRSAQAAGGSASSTKPWLISTMLPSGSATQTVRQPGMNASKSIGPGGDLRVGAHLRQHRVDVVDLEGEMPPAGVIGTGSRRRRCGVRPGSRLNSSR